MPEFFELERKMALKKIKSPSNKDTFLKVPIIREITFYDPKSAGQKIILTFLNTSDSTRSVRVQKVRHAEFDGGTITYTDDQFLMIERPKVINTYDARSAGQVAHMTFFSDDPAPQTPEDAARLASDGDFHHLATHVVRYTKDNDEKADIWVDVELIDKFRMYDNRDAGQVYIYTLQHPADDDFIGTKPALGKTFDADKDPYKPRHAIVDLTLGEYPEAAENEGVDPPYRLDPFGNIVNLSLGKGATGFIIGGRWYIGNIPNVEGDQQTVVAPTVFGVVAKRYDVDGHLLASMKSVGGGGTVPLTLGLDGDGNGIGGGGFYQVPARTAIGDNKDNTIIGYANKFGQRDFVAGPLFAKFNPSGNFVWGYETIEDNKAATGLDCDNDGNVFFAWSSSEGSFPPMVTARIGKMNPAGTVLWQKTFSPDANGASGVVCASDGRCFLNLGGAVDFSSPNYRIDAYDADGVNLLWTIANWFAIGVASNGLAVQGPTSKSVGKINIDTGVLVWQKLDAASYVIAGIDINSSGDIFFLEQTIDGDYFVSRLDSEDGTVKYKVQVTVDSGDLFGTTTSSLICSGTHFGIIHATEFSTYDYAPPDDMRHIKYEVRLYNQADGSYFVTIPWGSYYLFGNNAQPLFPTTNRLDASEILVLSRAAPI